MICQFKARSLLPIANVGAIMRSLTNYINSEIDYLEIEAAHTNDLESGDLSEDERDEAEEQLKRDVEQADEEAATERRPESKPFSDDILDLLFGDSFGGADREGV